MKVDPIRINARFGDGGIVIDPYPISNADPDEERRLPLLKSLFDPGTIQRLNNLNVGPDGVASKWAPAAVQLRNGLAKR